MIFAMNIIKSMMNDDNNRVLTNIIFSRAYYVPLRVYLILFSNKYVVHPLCLDIYHISEVLVLNF